MNLGILCEDHMNLGIMYEAYMNLGILCEGYDAPYSDNKQFKCGDILKDFLN